MLDLLSDGLQIALYGMTAVFALLGCLVVALMGMSRLANALEPAVPADSLGPADDAELMAAISAAIHAHQRRRR